jgi:hypothetical protein
MRRKQRALVWVLLFLLILSVQVPAHAAGGPQVDLTDRLNEIFRLRSRWLITGDSPPSVAADYVPDLAQAKRARCSSPPRTPARCTCTARSGSPCTAPTGRTKRR